jgi:integrase
MEAQGKDTRTLEEALKETAQRQWQGRRCYATNLSQSKLALMALYEAMGRVEGFGKPPRVCDVTAPTLRAATSQWYAQGLAPATINKRLNCLSAMGVSVEGCRVREPKALKWWLKPEDEARVLADLRGEHGALGSLSVFIPWTTRTGLRVEETLRLTRGDFSDGFRAVTVPGLKTSDAQATLPLGVEASELAQAVFAVASDAPTARFIPHTYRELEDAWSKVRRVYGWRDNPTATLKALRRSAARHLHVTKGMPLDMVRQYLRHEDIETTMGYLRLTGGYGTEEMRRWL